MSEQITTQPEPVQESKQPDPQSKETDRKDWHRGIEMTLLPLFRYKGYDPTPEVDVAQQKQLVDIVTVRRVDTLPDAENDIPDDYWEVFENFNQYNLISFKSYSESFDAYALMEFFGHLINYCKSKGREIEEVNLYAVVHHFPQKLLGPFVGTQFLEVVKENEIYDLCLSFLKPVRFIVCKTTDNPILALFSGDPKKFIENYQRIEQETDLLDEVGVYFDVFRKFYGELIKKMYTVEDFKRDYAPTPVILPRMPDHLKPQTLEQEIWAEVMYMLAMKETEARIQSLKDKETEAQETLVKERIEMVFNVLKHRYEDTLPIDEWQPLLAQCNPDQLKGFVDRAWEVNSLEAFGEELVMMSVDEQPITEQPSDELSA